MFKHTLLTKKETSDIWQNQNPILKKNELGVEIILNEDKTVSHYNIKLGNGTTHWNTLDYFYENLNNEDTNEILDDFTLNIATRKPVEDFLAMYGPNNTLKTGTPIDDDDAVPLKSLDSVLVDVTQIEQDISDLSDSLDTHKADTSAHSATATPGASRIAMYNTDSGLKSGKIPTENNDVIRFLEFNNEVSNINSKISTLNGAYYVLDSYNFGKTLDETDPADINILNTYAIANTPDASSMADVYNDTVIVNEFDTSEFVYNKISGLWVKYPNGYLTIATNDHLGVVKGTQPPTDPTDESKDTYVQVLSDGAMKLVGDRLGKVNTVDGVAPGTDKDIPLTVEMTKAEHDALEDPIGSGKYPSLAGKTVTLIDVYPKNTRRIPRPDYAKQQDISSLPWTADKTGYIMFNMEGMHTPATINFKINTTYFAFYNSSNVYLSNRRLVPISKGDVVGIEDSTSFQSGGAYCYFIPIKWLDVEEN
jgi:hypothetical protein